MTTKVEIAYREEKNEMWKYVIIENVRRIQWLNQEFAKAVWFEENQAVIIIDTSKLDVRLEFPNEKDIDIMVVTA